MSCDEMDEWNEIDEQIQEVVEEVKAADPIAPISIPEVKAEIDAESHRMIDLQKLVSGKPNLKKVEMARILKEAAKRVLERYRSRINHSLPSHLIRWGRKNNSS